MPTRILANAMRTSTEKWPEFPAELNRFGAQMATYDATHDGRTVQT